MGRNERCIQLASATARSRGVLGRPLSQAATFSKAGGSNKAVRSHAANLPIGPQSKQVRNSAIATRNAVGDEFTQRPHNGSVVAERCTSQLDGGPSSQTAALSVGTRSREDVDDMIEKDKGHGRQSRFRKDLINLNKAVVRWLKRVASGDMAHAEMIACICRSPVLKHLQDLHGATFCEDVFITE